MKAMSDEEKITVEEIMKGDLKLLTVTEAAQLLKINRNTIYDLINQGLLRGFKLGCTKVSTLAIYDFIVKCESGKIKYESKKKVPAKPKNKKKKNASKKKLSQNQKSKHLHN